MKKINNIFLALLLLLGMTACSQEAPFGPKDQEGSGRVLTSSLSVEVKNDEKVVRSAGVPSVNDFTVDFYNTAEETPYLSYKYGDMPDVVTLPVGTYKVRAYYGGVYGANGETAGFDKPYYLGESDSFTVEADKIVDTITPIVCRLSNVKVTIYFDESLVSHISSDSKVSVVVGNGSSLEFTPSTSESGYFTYAEGSTTLVATFNGVVDGEKTEERKTYSNVSRGVHYKITFKLHDVNSGDPGDINAGGDGDDSGVKVDASVQLEDVGGNGINVDPNEEVTLDDEDRPKEDPETPDDPGQDDPNDNPSDHEGPTITAVAPINLNKVNDVDATSIVQLIIESKTCFTEFVVNVESETLDLSEVGLSNTLDLINPGDYRNVLEALGLLEKNEELNKQTKKVFDISEFMELLESFPGRHDFRLTVSDEKGSTEVVLMLNVK